MAEISYKELVQLIESHPDYNTRWFNGVHARQALYIRFIKPDGYTVTSELRTAADGCEVVLDVSPDDQVTGIEIL